MARHWTVGVDRGNIARMEGSAVRAGISVVRATPNLDRILRLVRRADDIGLDVVGIQDHPYRSRSLDTWSPIPPLLAQTTRVTMFTDAANLRGPTSFARAAALRVAAPEVSSCADGRERSADQGEHRLIGRVPGEE